MERAWHWRDAEKKGHDCGRTTRGRRSSASALTGRTAPGGRATRRSLCWSLTRTAPNVSIAQDGQHRGSITLHDTWLHSVPLLAMSLALREATMRSLALLA